MIRKKKVLSSLSPYQQGKQIQDIQEEHNLDRVIKLSSNENPFGYSSAVKRYMDTKQFEFNIYPDGHASELRQVVAETLNVHENQLVFSGGSDELIQVICRTYLYPGARVAMATPTFPQYKHQALIEGAQIDEVPTINGFHDLQGMLDVITEDTNLVFICAPDNPTGTLIDQQAFTNFMEQCPESVLVILDEAYYEYTEAAHHLESLSYLNTYKNLIILRTFSKAYGLAGLRVGYGIMDEQLAIALNTVRGPFNTSAIAQKLASIAINDQEFIEQTVTKNRNNMEQTEQFFDAIGWHYYPSQANFLLVSTPIPGTEVFDHLIKYGFIIRPGELLGYPNTIRITIGTDSDMKDLQDALLKLKQTIDEG